MAKGTTIEKLFLSLNLDKTGLDADLLTAGKTVQQGMEDLTRKAQQTKLKMDIDMSRFPDAEKSVEALTLKEKYLTDQLGIQKQKVSLVNAAYQESVQAKGADDIASQKILTRLLREQKAEADLAAQISKTNSTRTGLANGAAGPVINTGTTNAASAAIGVLASQFGRVKDATQSAGNSIMAVNTKILALTAIAASGAGLFGLVKGAVDAGDAAYKLSSRLNLTAAESGNLNRMLKLSDVDAQSFISTMIRLDKSVSTAGKNGNTVTDAMKVFGISLTDASGSLLPMNQQLEQLALGYKNAAEAGEEEAYVSEVLGARGAALVPILRDYAVNAEAASRVKTIGIDPQQAHDLAIEMKVLNMESAQMQNALGMSLMPIAKEIIPDIIKGFDIMVGGIKENKEAIADSVKIAIELLGVAKDLGVAFAEIPKLVFDLEGIHSAKEALAELKMEQQVLKDHPIIATLDAVISASGLPGDTSPFRDKINEYKDEAADKIAEQERIRTELQRTTDQEKLDAAESKKIAQEKANAVIQARKKEMDAAKANAKAQLELAEEVYHANHTQFENDLHDIDTKRQKMIEDGVAEATALEISEARKKIIIDKNNKEIQKSSEDLATELYKLTHSATENRLLDIERERQEWIKKTHDEVRASQLAEEQKQKLFKDTLNSQLSEETRAVKEAILAGKSQSEAYDIAHKKHLADIDAENKAEQYVRNKNGVYMQGDTKTTPIIDGNSAYQKDEIITSIRFDTEKLSPELLAISETMGANIGEAIENSIKNSAVEVPQVAQAMANVNAPQQSNNQQSSKQGINLNLNNSVEFKGFTADEMNRAVERAKDAFGQELLSALQDANNQYGM